MNTKNILIIILAVLLIGGAYWYGTKDEVMAPVVEDAIVDGQNDQRIGFPNDENSQPGGKLKVANFSGKLEEVNIGCFVDGECYVVIDGKHVTTTLGWRQEVVGSVIGVPDFGSLESHIGQNFEVYAQDKGDGTYTLYGNEGFYIKMVK